MFRPEQRKHPRHEVVTNRAVLEWGTVTTSDGEDVVQLVDVSRGGACLITRDPPPHGQPLWLRMEAPVATNWVAARLVRREEPDRVAIRFEVEAPDDLMLAATLGIALNFGSRSRP